MSSLMVDPYPDPSHPLPRPLVYGAAALAVATIAIIATAQGTGVGVSRNPVTPALVSRELRFTDQPDGGLAVFDTTHDEEIARVAPDSGGFVRAALRGLDRNRLRHGKSEGAPFRLSVDAAGGVWLEDLATAQRTELRAFGPDNVAAFAAFLQTDRTARGSSPP